MISLALSMTHCAKNTNDIDHEKWNFIYTGDYSDAVVEKINDTLLTTDENKQESIVLDIDHDTRPDMEIISVNTGITGQSTVNKRAVIRTFENCEIIADTSLKSIIKTAVIRFANSSTRTEITSLDSILVTPRALDANYKINKDEYWYNSEQEMPFSFFQDFSVNILPPLNISGHFAYDEWGALNDTYLGFRILSSKDTLYGFIKMNVRDFTRINLENSAYR